MASGDTIIAGIPIPSTSPFFLAGVGVHVAIGLTAVAAGAPASRPAAPRPGARFELAAGPSSDWGGPGVDEPKIYVLRVKRNRVTAQAN